MGMVFAVTCVCAPHTYSIGGGQKRVSYPLVLEIQMFARCLVLGTEPRASAKPVSAVTGELYLQSLGIFLLVQEFLFMKKE